MCNLPHQRLILFQKEREEQNMSRKHVSETPHNPNGPATGVPTPEPRNEVLSKGKDHQYTGSSTPGTADHAHPGHADGGPGHKNCNHE